MGLGLLFAVLVGLSWVVTGAVVGLAERRGYGAWRHQFAYTAMYGAAALLILAAGAALRPGATAFSLRFNPLPALCVVLWGVFSYGQNICVGLGMRRGPNGVVWTIAQSGFIFPVTLGFATGNTPFTAPCAAGVLCVLAGVACCGKAHAAERRAVAGEEKTGGGWLLPALGGFVLCGLNQCAQALASFFPEETRPTPLVRVLCGAVGVLAAVAVHRALARRRPAEGWRSNEAEGRDYGYLLKICLVNAVVFFLAGLCFHYNALDRLEAAGRISVANPVMLASCLLGFTLYGAAALRERPCAAQLAGTALAIVGAILVAI